MAGVPNPSQRAVGNQPSPVAEWSVPTSPAFGPLNSPTATEGSEDPATSAAPTPEPAAPPLPP
eukprot:6154765-Alexandrium_andersonii.AAC.1